ncbi:MAG: hypothetical protein NTX50_06680 [Candidatus Sumerlaeota bacterium]|nr:hypothetical protein [Candidatus Sumerlaeota bacterium]
MSILSVLFGKRRVIGVEMFVGPTELAAQLAAQGKKMLALSDADDLDKLVARTDTDLRLDGELVAFCKTHFNIAHAASIPVND